MAWKCQYQCQYQWQCQNSIIFIVIDIAIFFMVLTFFSLSCVKKIYYIWFIIWFIIFLVYQLWLLNMIACRGFKWSHDYMVSGRHSRCMVCKIWPACAFEIKISGNTVSTRSTCTISGQARSKTWIPCLKIAIRHEVKAARLSIQLQRMKEHKNH